MKMPWRYRADGAWLSPPPRHETVTASRGSWPVLRNRKRTHVPGLVRLDKGHTRSGKAIGVRYAALPDSCRRNFICPAQRGPAHSNRRFRFRKKAKTPSRRNEGGSSGVAGNPGRPHRQRGAHAGAERIFTIKDFDGALPFGKKGLTYPSGKFIHHGHLDAGWSSLVARRAHNPKAAGSNPAPATIIRSKPFSWIPHPESSCWFRGFFVVNAEARRWESGCG